MKLVYFQDGGMTGYTVACYCMQTLQCNYSAIDITVTVKNLPNILPGLSHLLFTAVGGGIPPMCS